MKFPEKLKSQLNERANNNALRTLSKQHGLIDFSSNDYLGYAKSESLFDKAHQYLIEHNSKQNGSTGSRLLTGNHELYCKVEEALCDTYNAETALVFNSGYDANLGLFSSIPQRNDVILYDELVHASIRDGIQLSKAKSYKFKHNDLHHLAKMLDRAKYKGDVVYVATESVFSMDGDTASLTKMVELCKVADAYLVVDEAHAVGVLGKNGKGLVEDLSLEYHILARLITFGKALGCHGATILGAQELKDYLVNYARPFIYTTALPPHALATIITANGQLRNKDNLDRINLLKNISHFRSELIGLNLTSRFIESTSAIQSCIIPGNDQVKAMSSVLRENGFDVKPILSPTVVKHQERLRFCLHSFNTAEQISKVLKLLSELIEA